MIEHIKAVQKDIEDADSLGHAWYRFADGGVDFCAADEGYHNGPKCMTCGYWYCHHCQDGPDQPCGDWV